MNIEKHTLEINNNVFLLSLFINIIIIFILIIIICYLGDSSCGKSTLIHYLKHDPGPDAPKVDGDDVTAGNSFGVNPSNYAHVPVDNLDEDVTNTLALGYTFTDIQDEENEGRYIYLYLIVGSVYVCVGRV